MNYNPNWNNPQQNWNQPPAPTPSPKKNNKTIVIIVVIAVLVVGGLFYLASFLGKKFSQTIGKISESEIHRIEERKEKSNSQTYTDLSILINANANLPDSLKRELTQHLIDLEKMADDAKQLIKEYDKGFADTLSGQNLFSAMNKKWGHAYFIKTGRATTLKNKVMYLKEKAYADLPGQVQDNSVLDILDVYENAGNTPNYMDQFTGWENVHFNQPSIAVNENLSKFKRQISNYEDAILAQYRTYLEEINY